MFDCVVIGGGVIGGTILRELTKYALNVALLEKESDVCMGQSRANSGIVHAGFDAECGTNKAKFNVLGSKMMESYCKELGVKYRNNGSLVVAFSHEELDGLNRLKERCEINGVERAEIIDKDRLKQLEPNISDRAIYALYAPTGAIVCPYELTISAIGNAMDNGAKLYTDFEVNSVVEKDGTYAITSKNGLTIEAKTVINCAGLGSAKIAKLFGDDSFEVYPRKGEYILLDRESGDYVSHTIFFLPSKKGKGVLISQTVDNNVIVGPTSVEQDGTETSAEGLEFIVNKSREMFPSLPLYNTITSFAGVRAYCNRHDFIIEQSAKSSGLINCAGIESPGLSSAPAIAKYVTEEIVAKIIPLTQNKHFNPIRKPDYYFKDLSVEEKNEIIKNNPLYGKIICRCEQITEGEIVRAIKENPPATNVDAIKRRTRAGMGRCQGGFCQPQILEILARELNVDLSCVTKSGGKSNLIIGRTK